MATGRRKKKRKKSSGDNVSYTTLHEPLPENRPFIGFVFKPLAEKEENKRCRSHT